MNNKRTLASEYAEKINNYVNNWNATDIESMKTLEILCEKEKEVIEITNKTQFGSDDDTVFRFYVRNGRAGGRVWFQKGDDIQEVYQKAKIILIEDGKKRVAEYLMDEINWDVARAWWEGDSEYENDFTVGNNEKFFVRLNVNIDANLWRVSIVETDVKEIDSESFSDEAPVVLMEKVAKWAADRLFELENA